MRIPHHHVIGGATMRHRVTVAALAALAAFLPLATPAANSVMGAPQAMTSTQLLQYIYAAQYPQWCGAAGQWANKLRVKPVFDPKTMHAVMKATTDCSNTQYAQMHAPVWNMAILGAASAALIAARHEPPEQAILDATRSQKWSSDIVNFRRGGMAN